MTKIPDTVPLSKAGYYAKNLAKQLRGGEIIALSGNLGSGKTTFTQALGKALGVKELISSPTFVILQEFSTTQSPKLIFYHLDLYRTRSFREVKALGITDWWGHPKTITVIEWAEKIKKYLPDKTIYLKLVRDTNENRHHTI